MKQKSKYSSFQLQVMELLETKPASIIDIMEATKLSESYIRGQIKLMEETGRVEKVDERLPYMYRIPEDSPVVVMKQKVKEYKKLLMNPTTETDKTLVVQLRAVPKAQWAKIAVEMQAIAETIHQLDSEGLLVDTL